MNTKIRLPKKLIISVATIIIVALFNLLSNNDPQAPMANNAVTDASLASSSPIASSSESTQALPDLIEPVSSSSANIFAVTKVVDGDTLDVDINGKIERLRLIGVDTPETVDPRKAVQCFGKEASQFTKGLLSGKSVRLTTDPSQGERDKYGRLLVYVWLDKVLVNQRLIADGFAHEYTYHLPYYYQAEFKKAEAKARLDQRGLWSPDTCAGKK